MNKKLAYTPCISNAITACGNHHFMVAEENPPNIHAYALNGEELHTFTDQDLGLEKRSSLYGIRIHVDSILHIIFSHGLSSIRSIRTFKVWNIYT